MPHRIGSAEAQLHRRPGSDRDGARSVADVFAEFVKTDVLSCVGAAQRLQILWSISISDRSVASKRALSPCRQRDCGNQAEGDGSRSHALSLQHLRMVTFEQRNGSARSLGLW